MNEAVRTSTAGGIRLAAAALTALVGTVGCGAGSGAVREAAPPGFVTEVAADHPLVGTIWLPAEGRRATPAELIDRLAASELVLLGERHDNPDHHALQAWVVERLVAAGRRPALVMEMLSADQAAPLAAWQADPSRTAAGLGPVVGWDETGWPPWALYAPIAAPVVRASLPVVAANLGHGAVFRLAREGPDALPLEERRRLGVDEPLPDALRAALADELRDGHCGHAPEGMLRGLEAVQRARDGSFARALLDAAAEGTDGAVLVAGNGHVRSDRGVPWYLRRLAPGRTVAAVAFVEVVAGREVPTAWEDDGEGVMPYDAVWFTPRVDDVDPCERFREQLERMRTREP